jgi:hypothetical protein
MSDAQSQSNQPESASKGPAKIPEPISFAEFLEGVPPSQWQEIVNLWAWSRTSGNTLATPELQLHCTTDTCSGLRFFRFREGNSRFGEEATLNTYLTYVCSNCRKSFKTYSIQAIREDHEKGRCYKYGESPAYGPPTPARLVRLFGSESELFLKGRRCENQGLGIGAFVYYRRVVENHKNKILDEIIRVSEKIGAPIEMLAALNAAKAENQFSKAMESVKNAIPQALLVNGANPLTLLHSALSVGLHAQSDEQCLELAHDVRVVLIELAERLGQALKDEVELNTAVGRLMNVRQQA